MKYIIIIIPIINFLILNLIGRKIGNKGSIIISITLMGVISLISWWNIISNTITNKYEIIYIKTWINLELINIPFSFQFDSTSSLMIVLISFVSFIIHIYSTEYMNDDPHLIKFLSYLSLFTAFMLILVLSNNFILLFLGWEGVGLCSYLLIGFWYTRIQASKAAIKAIIVNKIGDLSLICGIIIIWYNTGTMEFNNIFLCIKNIDPIQINIALIFIIISVMGKSAQIGLHIWLPDAMEGPTPVSALIHAATMVTAGIYLIIKLSPIFDLSKHSLITITIIGSLTTIISSSIGISQNDLKKVIAFSTCSQLGFMLLICGYEYFEVSLFHLINHGFFKALLFLSVGSIIHSLNNNQDMRTMGNVLISQPITFSCLITGSLALVGLPFLSGFYSKDLIIELIINEDKMYFSILIALITTLFTSLYSTRLLILTFWNGNNFKLKSLKKANEPKNKILLSLYILALFTITIGFMSRSLIIKPNIPLINKTHKILPLIVTITGFWIIYILLTNYKIYIKLNYLLNNHLKKFYSMIILSWYFDIVIKITIINKMLKISFEQTYKLIDNQILEYWGPSSANQIPENWSKPLSKWSNGELSLYIIYLIISISIFIFIT